MGIAIALKNLFEWGFSVGTTFDFLTKMEFLEVLSFAESLIAAERNH